MVVPMPHKMEEAPCEEEVAYEKLVSKEIALAHKKIFSLSSNKNERYKFC